MKGSVPRRSKPLATGRAATLVLVYLSRSKAQRVIRKLRKKAKALELGGAAANALANGAAAVAVSAGSGPLSVAAGVGVGLAAFLGAGNEAARLNAEADILQDVLDNSRGKGVNIVFKQTRRDGKASGYRFNYYSRSSSDPKCGTRVTEVREGGGNTLLDISRC